MTFSEVSKMLDAGFTKEEILSFISPAETPAEVPAETPAEVPAETPAEVPAEIPAEVPAKTPANVPEASPVLNQLNDTMQKLIRTIQSSNLQSASMDKPTAEDMSNQVDKIMQSIIRPDIVTK